MLYAACCAACGHCGAGKLEISWKGALGEPGRLHSLVNMVNFKMPIRKEVDVQVPIATITTRCNIQCTMQHTTYNVQHAQL